MPSTVFPAPLPAGLQARRVDVDADRDLVIDLVRAYDDAFVGRPSQPPEQVVADLEESGDGLATDAWLVTEGGRAVGLGWFAVEDPAPPRPVLWFDVYVRPGPAGAVTTGAVTTGAVTTGEGLEAALVAAMLDRARRQPRPEGTEALLVESGCQQGDARTATALLDAGFSHERTFWRMERPLDASMAAPEPPPGVTVRRAVDTPADRAVLHRLFNATFDEHWGTVLRTEDAWWQRAKATVGVDPSQWWIAELGGEPVGLVLGDASRARENGGYVRTLGVTRAARGRGIGRHLLLVCFAEQARRGWAWSQLTVDSGNRSGAPGLYTSVGMRPVEVIDLYRGVLAPDGSLAPGTTLVS